MTAACQPVVTVEMIDPGVALVSLNRPSAMNALSRQMRLALAETMASLDRDDAARVVILTGQGKAFSAGLDLKEIAEAPDGLASLDDLDDFVRSIGLFRGPVIAAVNGPAVTGGFEIVLACDVILASETATFSDTHCRLGVVPGGGLSQKLSRTVGVYRAKQISLTGNFLTAQRAFEWGLVNEVVPQAGLIARARALAADMAGIDPDMVRAIKALIDDGHALPLGEAMAVERDRARSANAAVKGQQFADKREEIVARGRAQFTEGLL